jgi:hypothetical protein
MSLENPVQKIPEQRLTFEMIEALKEGYELEVENLRKDNIAYLDNSDQILSLGVRKEKIMQLGEVSVKAAGVHEELLRNLRKQSKLN